MTYLFTRRRDIAKSALTKQNHLGKCSNGKLRTYVLGTHRSLANSASALSSVKLLIMLKTLIYLIGLRFF